MECEVETKPANLEACERLEELTKELAAKYPQHKLSFGYIGNLGIWRDDRCFRVFTRYTRYSTRTSESYYLGAFEGVRFDEQQERNIREWAAHLDRQVAKGLLY